MQSAIPMVSDRSGLIQVATSDDVTRKLKQEAAARADANNNRPVIRSLAAHVLDCWETARTAKNDITERLLKAQRARAGLYDPEKLRAIRAFGGSEEYARVTGNKCRVAESWLRDVYLGQTEVPWTLESTPIPSLPPEAEDRVRKQVGQELAQAFAMMGEAPPPEALNQRVGELTDAEMERLADDSRATVARMSRKIEDQLKEGGWVKAMAEFLTDLSTYPAAHFKGPILRKNPSVKWAQGMEGWQPKVEDEITVCFERVDPFRCYPAPGVSSPQEGYFIEHTTYSRRDIYNLIGLDGFDEDSIRAVLDAYGKSGLTDWLMSTREDEIADINDEPSRRLQTHHAMIDCLEYHGSVQGAMLLDWGMEATEVPDAEADYEVCVWLIGQWVIKAQLNYDPMKRRPYFKTSYEELPGSYWGFGLVDLLEDVQGVVNAGIRSLVNNMGIASGPQCSINVDRLPPGEDITDLHPWKIWQVKESEVGLNTPAIEFFQPNSNVHELLAVVEKFYQFADDFSLIPRFMAGNDRVGGPGRTASGLSMLMNAANKGLKGVVSNVDVCVITPLLEQLYAFNMLFDDDMSIKGDAKVVARGAVSLMQLETLQLRRNEFLTATANPIDSQIVGVEGRAEILREVAKGLDMDVNRVVPPRAVMEAQKQQQMAAQAEQQQPQQPAPNQETLDNGAATTDNFSPSKLRPTS